MQTPQFNEKKATQVASAFMEKTAGRMNYTRLLKLMYLVDRASLIETGRSVTFDSYASLKFGPVLETVKRRIDSGKSGSPQGLWSEYINIDPDDRYSVALSKKCEPEDLSESDLALVEKISQKYGNLELFDELIDGVMHKLPEWSDPGDSSIPITYEDILTLEKGETNSPENIEAIRKELEGLALMDQLLEAFSG